ncbi:MAG: hypothetical protein KatS3mg109_0441 [Pirellulaceae bacterium]|nr:MAG: hypothetical protein KatS3mg109_0441 [Pirellulaceae bacterium]
MCSFPAVQQTHNFHYLCTRPFPNNVLLPSFAMLLALRNVFFADVATRLYDDLYSTNRSVQGVWPDSLVQPGKRVRVYRDWNLPTHQFVDRPAFLTDATSSENTCAQLGTRATTTSRMATGAGALPITAPIRH